MKRKHILFTLYSLLFTLILMACANMGTPDGGPYDETPPKIVRTTPKFGATGSDATKIVIEFDEIVKIENAQEKVVVSPPQLEQPEIEASGRKVVVTLLDSLKPGMTYTIDFGDAIVDNNEGNPYGDYAFTFSTGERIDTFQVSGNVLDASNLEPIKNMLVGLYRVGDDGDEAEVAELHDSVFRTIPFERISRTDSRGHFVVKGLAPGKYRAFALNDQNQNFVYDQRSEMIAFSERILATSSKPDVRQDTIWHDSIHYDSIVPVPYTHYYPDDVVLMAFESAKQNLYKLKEERPIPQQFTIIFTAPCDTLPKLTGLNFDAEDAFIIDASQKKDTVNYWIRDSLIYNLDTLGIRIDYYGTDTLGNLAPTVDTLYLVSKLTKEKIAKQQKEKYEEWVKECKQKTKEERRAKKNETKKDEDENEQLPVEQGELVELTDSIQDAEQQLVTPVEKEDNAEKIDEDTSSGKKKKKKKKDDDIEIEIPPMPEEFMEFKTTNAQSLDPDKNIDFTFPEPLDSVDMSKIHFYNKVDSIITPARFLFRRVPGKVMTYRFYAEWEADSAYSLEIDTAAFVSIYGKRNEATKRNIKVKSLDSYSTLFVVLSNAPANSMVQLIDASDKPVKTVKAQDGKADFYFVNPGTYYMRLYDDANGNGEWDTGEYDDNLQPEQMYYYPEALTLKAQWEITQDWNPTAVPLPKQKPAKITKQKPDKEKSIKKKNFEREAQKRSGK